MRPDSGDALDQPAQLMREMRLLDTYYGAVKRAREAKDLNTLSDTDRANLRKLLDAGMWYYNG